LSLRLNNYLGLQNGKRSFLKIGVDQMTIAKTLTPIFSKVQNRNSFTANKQNWAKRKHTCPYAGASKPKQR